MYPVVKPTSEQISSVSRIYLFKPKAHIRRRLIPFTHRSSSLMSDLSSFMCYPQIGNVVSRNVKTLRWTVLLFNLLQKSWPNTKSFRFQSFGFWNSLKIFVIIRIFLLSYNSYSFRFFLTTSLYFSLYYKDHCKVMPIKFSEKHWVCFSVLTNLCMGNNVVSINVLTDNNPLYLNKIINPIDFKKS